MLESLRPYLRIKTRQADLKLELCDLNQSKRGRTFVLPAIIPGESMLPLADAAERAGRSYATAVQCVKLENVPFVRDGRRVFVPESYIDTWRGRSRGAMRRPEISERMADIAVEIKSLNSGKRGQVFKTLLATPPDGRLVRASDISRPQPKCSRARCRVRGR